MRKKRRIPLIFFFYGELQLQETGAGKKTPPYAYETAECNQLLSDLAAGSATNENTVIMLERSVRSDDPTAPGGWQITESRNYGETAVFYIESADDDSDIERSDDSAA